MKNLYSTWIRKSILDPEAVALCAVYEDAFLYGANRWNVDPDLMRAVCWQESRYGMLLTPPGPSGTGDNGFGLGLMQIDFRGHKNWALYATWQNPRVNIEYASMLMNENLKRFNNNLYYAVCAYNTGPGDVKKAIAEGNDPGFYTKGGTYGRWVIGFFEEIKNAKQ